MSAPVDLALARFVRDLDRVDGALATHLMAAVARFGNAALGVIDLPPLATSGAIVPAQVTATAALFWCAQVERAGLPAFVEALAEGVVHGTINLPVTTGGDRLMQFWRGRQQRFSAGEREALYRHTFGSPGDHGGFDGLWTDFVNRLSAIGRSDPQDSLQRMVAGVNVIARELASYLSDHGTGMAAFAAREIVGLVRTTLAIMRDPDIVTALGGGSPWQIIGANAPSVLGHAVDPSTALPRATAGYTLIQWLADHVADLDGGGLPRIDPMSDVVRAALVFQAETEAS